MEILRGRAQHRAGLFLERSGTGQRVDHDRLPGRHFHASVGYYTTNRVTHGFLLIGGRFTTIDYPGASSTFPSMINPRGDIVGAYTAGGMGHGFLLSDGVYTTIDFPGATDLPGVPAVTLALAIGPLGDVVRGYRSAGVSHAFLLSG